MAIRVRINIRHPSFGHRTYIVLRPDGRWETPDGIVLTSEQAGALEWTAGDETFRWIGWSLLAACVIAVVIYKLF